MRFTQAKRLHNEDEVEVRVEPGKWAHGRVLGEPRLRASASASQIAWVEIPVLLDDGTYLPDVAHTDVR
jgi:hypothetical protein